MASRSAGVNAVSSREMRRMSAISSHCSTKSSSIARPRESDSIISARCAICADVARPPESAASSNAWSGTERQMNAARRPATSCGVSVAASAPAVPVSIMNRKRGERRMLRTTASTAPFASSICLTFVCSVLSAVDGLGVERAVEGAPGQRQQVALGAGRVRGGAAGRGREPGHEAGRHPFGRRHVALVVRRGQHGLDVGDEAPDLLVRRETAGGGEVRGVAEEIADGVPVLERGDPPQRRRPDLRLHRGRAGGDRLRPRPGRGWRDATARPADAAAVAPENAAARPWCPAPTPTRTCRGEDQAEQKRV